MLPAASVARTLKLCEPSPRAAVVLGLVQAPKAAESSLHSKVEPGSVELNANDALVAVVVPVGPEVIVVSGAVVSGGGAVSTVNERVAGEASVLPATSVARTDTECAPSASAEVVHGLVQFGPRPRVHAALEHRVGLAGA